MNCFGEKLETFLVLLIFVNLNLPSCFVELSELFWGLGFGVELNNCVEYCWLITGVECLEVVCSKDVAFAFAENFREFDDF